MFVSCCGLFEKANVNYNTPDTEYGTARHLNTVPGLAWYGIALASGKGRGITNHGFIR